MTRRVVVGVDGSSAATAALRWAAGEAVATGAQLVVVHAVGLLEHAGLATAPAQEAREDVVRRVVEEAGLDATRLDWRVVDGEPCAALLRQAGGADLVVVGTRGAGAHSGTLLGSTSLALAEHAVVPLVIVPSSPD